MARRDYVEGQEQRPAGVFTGKNMKGKDGLVHVVIKDFGTTDNYHESWVTFACVSVFSRDLMTGGWKDVVDGPATCLLCLEFTK